MRPNDLEAEARRLLSDPPPVPRPVRPSNAPVPPQPSKPAMSQPEKIVELGMLPAQLRVLMRQVATDVIGDMITPPWLKERREKPITVHLVNGQTLQGELAHITKFNVLLREGDKEHLIERTAISHYEANPVPPVSAEPSAHEMTETKP